MVQITELGRENRKRWAERTERERHTFLRLTMYFESIQPDPVYCNPIISEPNVDGGQEHKCEAP